MCQVISNFKPDKKGLSQVLGGLERKLLGYLWEASEATGREIFEGVVQTRNNAYHTILTVLNRMVKKGLLRKKKKRNLYHFAPVFSREEFTKLACKEVVGGALEISQEATITGMVDLLAEKGLNAISQLEREIATKRLELRNGYREFPLS